MKKLEATIRKHKTFWYVSVALGAIIFTRIYVNFVHDPGPSLFGLELHHFDYALITFIVTTLVQMFMKKASVYFLMVNAFSLGWLIDEIPYIRFNIVDKGLEYYNGSLFPVLMIFIVVPLTILFVAKKEKAQKRAAAARHFG